MNLCLYETITEESWFQNEFQLAFIRLEATYYNTNSEQTVVLQFGVDCPPIVRTRYSGVDCPPEYLKIRICDNWILFNETSVSTVSHWRMSPLVQLCRMSSRFAFEWKRSRRSALFKLAKVETLQSRKDEWGLLSGMEPKKRPASEMGAEEALSRHLRRWI